MKRRDANYFIGYTNELRYFIKNSVVSTGKLQNAKPRLTESRDHR